MRMLTEGNAIGICICAFPKVVLGKNDIRFAIPSLIRKRNWRSIVISGQKNSLDDIIGDIKNFIIYCDIYSPNNTTLRRLVMQLEEEENVSQIFIVAENLVDSTVLEASLGFRHTISIFDEILNIGDATISIGCNASASKRSNREKFDAIINCTNECKYEIDETENTYYYEYPLEDSNYTLVNIDECIKFIELHVENGHKILIHCRMGISRSPTVLIAYLMKKCNKTYEESHDMILSKRSSINPNRFFRQQLHKMYSKLHNIEYIEKLSFY